MLLQDYSTFGESGVWFVYCSGAMTMEAFKLMKLYWGDAFSHTQDAVV